MESKTQTFGGECAALLKASICCLLSNYRSRRSKDVHEGRRALSFINRILVEPPPESVAAAILTEFTVNAHMSDLCVQSLQGRVSLTQRHAAVNGEKNASGAASGDGRGQDGVRPA